MTAATTAERSPSLAAPPGSAVALEEVTVRYGRTTALDSVSLAVERGQVYALLGRNGAGKSSAVRVLLGQRRPEKGRAVLLGLDAWKRRAAAMERTGVVPEEPDAPPELTTVELHAFCARVYKRWDRTAVEARLARFGVPAKVPFGRLSKGQKAQVLIALALGHGPELLVLDDPTLGLDPVARRAFFEELISDLADRGTTVFLTTHDLAGVERIASHVGILRAGRLIVDEELESLKARFRLVRHKAAVGDPLGAVAPVGSRVREWGAETVVSAWDETAFESLRRTPALEGAEVAPLPLEDIFATLVGESSPDGGPTR